MTFTFEIQASDPYCRARAGLIRTVHGDVETPAFMPVATQASVKSLASEDLLELGVQLIIANTYHLALRPGSEEIARMGGLGGFMNWPRVISTDSGGFQVFSLGAAIRDGVGKIADIFPDERPVAASSLFARSRANPSNEGGDRGEARPTGFVKIDDDGVDFSSHLDGSLVRLTPERSIEIQSELGADFMLAFDECTSPLDSIEYTRTAMQRTHRWAERCLEQYAKLGREHQSLFGIVQGGAFRELREESAQFIGRLPFQGIAIGGSLGRSKRDMHSILDWTVGRLPNGKPRHLLGIGEPADIVSCVDRGIDIFDCAAPSRWARNGSLILSRNAARAEGIENQRMNIENARWASDTRPVDEECHCLTCRSYTRAYLHHLHRAKELTYYRLATIHNLHFMMQFMRLIRESIRDSHWAEFKARESVI